MHQICIKLEWSVSPILSQWMRNNGFSWKVVAWGSFEISKIRSFMERWYSNDPFVNKFICLLDYGRAVENWEWEADIWSSIQRTTRYLATIVDRYCSKCRGSTQGKSILSLNLQSFQYYPDNVISGLTSDHDH